MSRQSKRSDDFWENEVVQFLAMVAVIIAVAVMAQQGVLDDTIIAIFNSFSSCAPQQPTGQ